MSYDFTVPASRAQHKSMADPPNPTQALGMVPVIGLLYAFNDILFIFRESRKCLHDTIADTVVVKD